MLLNYDVGEDSWESLGQTARRSILKEISPEYSLEALMLKLKLQYFGHLMWRTDSLEKTLMLEKIEGRRRRGWQKMRWLDVQLDGHEFEQALGVGDGQGSQACCSPLESQSWARLSNWTLGFHKTLNLGMRSVCVCSHTLELRQNGTHGMAAWTLQS